VFAEWRSQNVYPVVDDFCRTGRFYREPISTSMRSPAICRQIFPAMARKTQQSRTSVKLNWWLVPERGADMDKSVRQNNKPTLLTRRQMLASGVAIASAIPLLSTTRAAAAPESRTAAVLRLTAGTRTLAVNGKPARVFGLTGPNGTPGITLSSGERFHVDLVNQAGTSTLVHWHGQLPPWRQDGFP
jgi:hypothetical protein